MYRKAHFLYRNGYTYSLMISKKVTFVATSCYTACHQHARVLLKARLMLQIPEAPRTTPEETRTTPEAPRRNPEEYRRTLEETRS